jgi:hypothetical protein
VFWAGLPAKCATECATAGILCNSTALGVEPIDATPLRLGIRRSMLRPYTNLTSTNIESLLFSGQRNAATNYAQRRANHSPYRIKLPKTLGEPMHAIPFIPPGSESEND